MELPFQTFSNKYQVRRLLESDLPELLALAEGNPAYYEHMHERPALENLRADMTKLPPQKAPEDKYFLGYFQDGRLAAVLDLIAAYPNPETAFIGWFMLRKDLQGRGKASEIIGRLLSRLPFRYIRLGYVKGNEESERFWKSLHFAPTGLELSNSKYTVAVMQLGKGDTHAFGIMPDPPEPGRRYDDYQPERYTCAWAEDGALSETGGELSGIDACFHTLDQPGKGLAWCGITLIPPSSIPAVLAAVSGHPALRDTALLLERAGAEHKFVIHFGI